MMDDKRKSPMELGEEILGRIGDSLNDMDLVELSENIRASVEIIRQEAERGYRIYVETQKQKIEQEEQERRMRRKFYAYERFHKGENRRNAEAAYEMAPVIREIPGKFAGPFEIAMGIIALITFGGLSFGFGITTIVHAMIGGWFTHIGAGLLGLFLPLTAASGLLMGHGIFANKRAKRLTRYDRIFKGKDYIMLKDLVRMSGQDEKKVLKDIDYILKKNLIPGLTLDEKKTCLMFTEEAKEQYYLAEKARIEREQEAIREKAEQERLELEKSLSSKEEKEALFFQEECRRFLDEAQIKKEEIQSLEMRQHITNIEITLSRICICIKEHPDMISGTGHLITYYLPCMSKLIKTYEDLEDEPIQGENIKKTQKEIEASFDTIEDALTNMYDELFRNVSMDISSDIQVLKAMMAQDGLNEDGFKLQ